MTNAIIRRKAGAITDSSIKVVGFIPRKSHDVPLNAYIYIYNTREDYAVAICRKKERD